MRRAIFFIRLLVISEIHAEKHGGSSQGSVEIWVDMATGRLLEGLAARTDIAMRRMAAYPAGLDSTTMGKPGQSSIRPSPQSALVSRQSPPLCSPLPVRVHPHRVPPQRKHASKLIALGQPGLSDADAVGTSYLKLKRAEAEDVASAVLNGMFRAACGYPSSEDTLADAELKSMERLDFTPVLVELVSRARLRRAAELIAASVEALPTSLKEVQAAYQLVYEVMEAGLMVSLRSVIDVRMEIAKLERTTALEVEELNNIFECITSLHELVEFCEGSGGPRMHSISKRIKLDPALVEAFDGAIEEGDLSGQKFPDIQRWRKELEAAENAVTAMVMKLLKDSNFQSMLDPDSPSTSTVKGRVVFSVPVKDRKKVGTVHGVSQDGNIAYVEPKVLARLVDEKVEAQAHLRLAEGKALSNLSFYVGRSRESLLKSIEAAAEIDAARAKAELGEAWNGVVPEVRDEGRFEAMGLMNAALAVASARFESVGNDVDLDMRNEDAPQGLMISGPNGGGKTVVMKAVALAALLVRLGVPIPAGRGARVDVFSPVLAVIGDAQSVEGKVSTFQAHCLSLKEVLRRATPGSLLVCDEVGTGTDPAQGEVLAQAVLEECLDQGAVVLATTHYTRVKDFSLKDDRLALGAMLLNDNGGPTFRLLVPGLGESHGIETARRMFAKEFEGVVERARSLMDTRERELSDLLLEVEEMNTALEVGQVKLKEDTDATRQAREITQGKLKSADAKFKAAVIGGMGAWRERLTSEERKLESSLQRARSKRDRTSIEALAPSLEALAQMRGTIDQDLTKLTPENSVIPLGDDQVSAGQSLLLIAGPYKGRVVQVIEDRGKKIIISLGEAGGGFNTEARRTDLAIPNQQR